MSYSNFISRAFGLVFVMVITFCGFTNCGGGGGSDPKPPPPPPTYTDVVNGSQGVVVSPSSATGVTGEMKVYSITLSAGYTNPVATPAGGTFSNGIAAGTYNFTLAIGSSNRSFTVSATPPTPLYNISGKVTGGAVGATLTLSTGKSVNTDANGVFTFTGVPTGNYIINVTLYGWNFNPSFRNVGVNNADSTGNDFTATLANPTVEMLISFVDHDNSGAPNNLVRGMSLVPLTAGTTFVGWVQEPGKSNRTILAQFTATQDGGYLSARLHNGVGFYSSDGTPYASGVATYGVDITTKDGVKTSVIGKVPVLMGSGLLFGPLQQPPVVSPDGKSIKLVGSFPTPPTVVLETTYKGYSVIVASPQGQDYVIAVPSGVEYSGSLALFVSSGYPNAECSSAMVNIPVH